jgi:hypothetical protein
MHHVCNPSYCCCSCRCASCYSCVQRGGTFGIIAVVAAQVTGIVAAVTAAAVCRAGDFPLLRRLQSGRRPAKLLNFCLGHKVAGCCCCRLLLYAGLETSRCCASCCSRLQMGCSLAALLTKLLVFAGVTRTVAAAAAVRRAGDFPLLRLVLQPPADGLQPGGTFGLLLDFRAAHGSPPGSSQQPVCLQVRKECTVRI